MPIPQRFHNDPERHFARDGANEALEQARRDGKVRFIGFTGHKDPSIHLEMLSHTFERQMEKLRKRVRDEASDGRFELYKTTAMHEGKVGRQQHGFPTEEELPA